MTSWESWEISVDLAGDQPTVWPFSVRPRPASPWESLDPERGAHDGKLFICNVKIWEMSFLLGGMHGCASWTFPQISAQNIQIVKLSEFQSFHPDVSWFSFTFQSFHWIFLHFSSFSSADWCIQFLLRRDLARKRVASRESGPEPGPWEAEQTLIYSEFFFAQVASFLFEIHFGIS